MHDIICSMCVTEDFIFEKKYRKWDWNERDIIIVDQLLSPNQQSCYISRLAKYSGNIISGISKWVISVWC